MIQTGLGRELMYYHSSIFEHEARGTGLTWSLIFVLVGTSVLRFPGEDREEGKGRQSCLSNNFLFYLATLKLRQLTLVLVMTSAAFLCQYPSLLKSFVSGQEENITRIHLKSSLQQGTPIKPWEETEKEYSSLSNVQSSPNWTCQTCYSNSNYINNYINVNARAHQVYS